MKKSHLVELLAQLPDDAQVFVWDLGAGGLVPNNSIQFYSKDNRIVLGYDQGLPAPGIAFGRNK